MKLMIKLEDLFTLEYITTTHASILSYILSFEPSGDEILTDMNLTDMEYDYHFGNSGEKWLSPLVIKCLIAVLDANNLSIEDLIEHRLTIVDLTLINRELFSKLGTYKLARNIYHRFASKWKHIWDALNTAYNPLENYSMLEERTPDITKERTLDTTDERTPDLTKTTNGTGTTSTDSQTGIFGFNSASSNPSGTIDGNQTDTITDRTETETGTDTSTQSGTITDTETGTETLERSGNIGVTTSQQMLQSEFEVRKYDFYKEIYKDIDSILCLKIY